MPVRNAAPYLALSIASILNQTATDFEFVILDDASTDDSRAIIQDWARRDQRIRLVESRSPLGPAGSADRVVREARSPICARMDADDVSHPNRLQAQWEVLDRHPEVSLVGTLSEGIDRQGRRVRPRDRWRLCRPSVFAPFPHGSIMFRRDWFLDLGGYRAACAYWEDFDLYLRMEVRGPIMVISDALYQYRFHAAATTASSSQKHLAAVDLMYRCADRATAGEDYSPLLIGDASRPGATIDARAFLSFGSPRLWAGENPATLRDLWRVGARVPRVAFFEACVLAAWGEVSPRSLKWLLRGFVRLRDAAASVRIGNGSVRRWVPRPPRVGYFNRT